METTKHHSFKAVMHSKGILGMQAHHADMCLVHFLEACFNPCCSSASSAMWFWVIGCTATAAKKVLFIVLV